MYFLHFTILAPFIEICELMTKVAFLPFQRRKGLLLGENAVSSLLLLFLVRSSTEGQAGHPPHLLCLWSVSWENEQLSHESVTNKSYT